jgi:predicted phage tail component-like protein
MRNYVILNDQSSEEIDGLLIQSLPPISKPQIRTNIEEIDGRDGDIVTKLGYGAYTKTISIGLYGDFDIDDIIAFFNSEGTVTFSNEPDKVYNYQITAQIDFERLVRYRTAKVDFHVQPFKYSIEEIPKSFNAQLLNVPNFTKTTNGITVSVQNNVFTISGTGSAATEFYVPIKALSLDIGSYMLRGTTDGAGAGACSVRVIYNSPSNATSFGNNYVTLVNNDTVSLTSTATEPTNYNYVYLYITSGSVMNFTLNLSLLDGSTQALTLKNNGNYFSRPAITVYGTGTVNLSLNGSQMFVIGLGSDPNYLTIDTTAMEAYKDSPGTLMNRAVDGDYDNFKLNPGSNTISWTGNVTQVIVDNYSRWL